MALPQRSRSAEDQGHVLAQQHRRICAHAAGERRCQTRRTTAECDLLGTYFAKQLSLRQGRFRHRSAHHASLVEGCRARGRTTTRAMFCSGETLAAKLARTRRAARSRLPAASCASAEFFRPAARRTMQIVAPLRSGAADSGQARRGAARLRQRPDQAGGRAGAPRSQEHVGAGSTTAGTALPIRSRLPTSCRKRFRTRTPSRFARSRRTKARCCRASKA